MEHKMMVYKVLLKDEDSDKRHAISFCYSRSRLWKCQLLTNQNEKSKSLTTLKLIKPQVLPTIQKHSDGKDMTTYSLHDKVYFLVL